jgi:hypothetical protein
VLIFVEYAIVLINAVIELSSNVGCVRPDSVIIVSNDIKGTSKNFIVGNEVGFRVEDSVGIIVGIIVGGNINNEYFVLCISDCEYV